MGKPTTAAGTAPLPLLASLTTLPWWCLLATGEAKEPTRRRIVVVWMVVCKVSLPLWPGLWRRQRLRGSPRSQYIAAVPMATGAVLAWLPATVGLGEQVLADVSAQRPGIKGDRRGSWTVTRHCGATP